MGAFCKTTSRGADDIIVSPDRDRMKFLFFAKSLVHAWPPHTARGGQGVSALGGGPGLDDSRAAVDFDHAYKRSGVWFWRFWQWWWLPDQWIHWFDGRDRAGLVGHSGADVC